MLAMFSVMGSLKDGVSCSGKAIDERGLEMLKQCMRFNGAFSFCRTFCRLNLASQRSALESFRSISVFVLVVQPGKTAHSVCMSLWPTTSTGTRTRSSLGTSNRTSTTTSCCCCCCYNYDYDDYDYDDHADDDFYYYYYDDDDYYYFTSSTSTCAGDCGGSVVPILKMFVGFPHFRTDPPASSLPRAPHS